MGHMNRFIADKSSLEMNARKVGGARRTWELLYWNGALVALLFTHQSIPEGGYKLKYKFLEQSSHVLYGTYEMFKGRKTKTMRDSAQFFIMYTSWMMELRLSEMQISFLWRSLEMASVLYFGSVTSSAT